MQPLRLLSIFVVAAIGLFSLRWLAPEAYDSASNGLVQLIRAMLVSAPRVWHPLDQQVSALAHQDRACLCPGKAVDMWTRIDVGRTSAADEEVKELVAQALMNWSSIANTSTSLRVQPSNAQVHIEVLSCHVVMDPAEAYSIATTMQRALGGGPLNWSVMLEPGCPQEDEDLKYYVDLLSSHSEQKELVASQRSNFSHAAIWRIGSHMCLMLNNVIMSDSRDEHKYHELLVHPALLAAEQPRRALIIGGGEGATLREVLRDARIEHVTMVDVDEGLVRLCQEHLRIMHQGSFDSPKLTLVFEDGIGFLRRMPPESFDVIIVDGIDFSDQDEASYGNELFSMKFYSDVHRVLRVGGTFEQYVSDVDKEDNSETLIMAGFSDAQYMCVDIESFLGMGACFVVTGKDLAEPLVTRLEHRAVEFAPEGGWKYLTQHVLSTCMSYQARRLKGGGGGSGGGRGGGHGGHHCHGGRCGGAIRAVSAGPALLPLGLVAFLLRFQEE